MIWQHFNKHLNVMTVLKYLIAQLSQTNHDFGKKEKNLMKHIEKKENISISGNLTLSTGD